MQPAAIDPTLDLCTRYPLRLGGLRQCGIRSLPDISTHGQHWELNPRHSDLESNALSIGPHAPMSQIDKKGRVHLQNLRWFTVLLLWLMRVRQLCQVFVVYYKHKAREQPSEARPTPDNVQTVPATSQLSRGPAVPNTINNSHRLQCWVINSRVHKG